MTFVPTLNDFESHLVDYPPFPPRLLLPSAPASSSSFSATSKRRVRPIAVPPPPGFHHLQPQQNGQDKPNYAFASSSSGSSSMECKNYAKTLSGGSLGASYVNKVKVSAIAGALAGDWSSYRSLPDIPSFLLTHLLLHFDVNSPSSLDLQSHDLASFCLQHNIHSNLTSPAFDTSTNVGSASQSGPVGFDMLNNVLNRVVVSTSRYASNSVHSVDSGSNVVATPHKRRLAPTAVTTDALFNQQQKFTQNTADTFHKTPRAPKDVKEVEIKREKEFGVFPTASISSKIFNTDFADIPVDDNSTNVNAEAETTRPKIPPPQPSSPARRRSQREKQLYIGKNTPEYQNYIALVPFKMRRRGDPITPDVDQEISKRNWEGQVRKWRRMLHEFDVPNGYNVQDVNDEEEIEEEEAVEIDYDGGSAPEGDKENVFIHQPVPVIVKKWNIEEPGTSEENSDVASPTEQHTLE